ncbi:MAG: PilZ domain-containing protein, partial [Pseudomonadota bacterium]
EHRQPGRSADRNVVSYFGIITCDRSDPVKVELVDLSAEGARMVAPSDFDPADSFVLKIPETGACFTAEIAWRNGATFGVKFVSHLKTT